MDSERLILRSFLLRQGYEGLVSEGGMHDLTKPAFKETLRCSDTTLHSASLATRAMQNGLYVALCGAEPQTLHSKQQNTWYCMSMSEDKSITKHFGDNLARLLSAKILQVYPKFNSKKYIHEVKRQCGNLGYTERVELHADALRRYLPTDYKKSIEILAQIMSEENANETGMFKEYYWLLPVGKYIEKYGIDSFSESIAAIEELTKRNTGEYAIRVFIKRDPKRTIKIMKRWAQSKNFHLRRLASEGLRPKLPWATKLETFIDDPFPVFEILELLKEDKVKFVKKSVANNLADYLKVNKTPTVRLINKWKRSKNIDTLWIIKHATRKASLD